MKKTHNLVLIFIFIGISSISFAQTPSSNCNLGNAGAEITVGGSCSFITWDSNNNSNYWNSASGCGATDYDDAWGWFTATGTSTTITYSPDAGYDAILSLFTGACATSLSSIACADNAGSGGDETITYATTIGTIYMVRIQEYWGSGSMFGDICVYGSGGGGGAPSNDLCAGATSLPCATTNLAGTTVGSTNVADPSGCGSNYGVWYTFVGDGQSTTISSTATFDHEMVISSGSCASLSNITCEDGASSGGTETYTFTSTVGVNYYVYIAHYSTSSTTTGTFTISRTCTAPGSECVPNTVIASLPYTQTGLNTSGSGDDFDDYDACSSYSMTGDDYVFTYTPAVDECVNINLSNTNSYVGVFLTEGCPTTGTCIAYETYAQNPSISEASLTGGVTYFITVSTDSWDYQTTPFDISMSVCPPPIIACSGTFYDSGGSGGQYANNEYTKTTYCSGSTDCISFNFTSFNTESGYDYLDVYDGPSTSSPYIDSYSGTTLNGQTITSSSGCLTFVFDSDGGATAAGWAATISCAACPPPPPPVAQDCNGGTSICSDASFSGNSDGYGFDEELSSSNQGCLSGGENQTSWYFFEAATAGTLEFGIKPQNGTDDYDFAMWGPYPSGSTPSAICPPTGAPVRCSFAAGAPNPTTGTGLKSGAGDSSEGTGGDDIVNPLNLNVGDVYILVIDNYSESTSPFDMDLSLTSGLTLNCNQLPIELIDFNGFAENGFNLLKWTTAVEINNDYFEIEKSLNGVLFEKFAQVAGAGNSNIIKNYEFVDNDAYKGITYYRLKQIDYNGTMSYSSVVAVKQSLGAEVSVFPNPTIDKVKMNFVSKEDGTYKVVVSDVSKVLYEQILVVSRGNQIVNFDYFTDLAKGFYIVQIMDEDGNIIKTERVVKQ